MNDRKRHAKRERRRVKRKRWLREARRAIASHPKIGWTGQSWPEGYIRRSKG